MADPMMPRAAALEAARQVRNATRVAAWTRFQQAQETATEVYVAECVAANEQHAATLAEIDAEFPEVPDARD